MPEDILFDLNAFGERGIELAQLAGTTEAAGRVETLTGTVTVRRLNGETANLSEGDEIFMGDTLEVSSQGSIGVVFADDTTMALGEGAELIIDEMVYDPTGEDGSLAVSVANGVFSFVSGQISKAGDEAMVINTPVATIGIRGTKGAGLAAPEGSRNTISLMQEDDGQTGELVIRTQGGVQVLNQPGQTVALQSRFEPPPPPQLLTAETMENMYQGALGVLPPPPRRRPPPPQDEGPRNRGENDQNNQDSDADGVLGETQQAGNETAIIEAGREAVNEVIAEAAADGEITEEEAAQIAEAMAETGAFGDSEEAVAAATEAYIAALESGATAEEAALIALTAGQTVVAGEQAAEATDELLQEVATNVDGDTSENGLFSNAIAGSLEDVSENTTDSTFSNDVGELGTQSEQDEQAESDDDKLVEENLPADEEVILNDGEEAIEGEPETGLGFEDLGLTDPESLLGASEQEPSVQEQFAAQQEQQTDTNQTQGTTNNPSGPIITNVDGTTASEQVFGTSGANIIKADAGDDWVVGEQGNDTIFGEAGNDVIYGDAPLIGLATTDASGIEISTGGDIDHNDFKLTSTIPDTFAFHTTATFGADDTNGSSDIYLKKLDVGSGSASTMELISKKADGTASTTGSSQNAQMSGDGKYIFFQSSATDLAATSTNTNTQIYRYEISTGTLLKVSETSASVEANAAVTDYSVSDDGNLIAFATAATNLDATNDGTGGIDIYLKNMTTGTVTLVSKETSNSADGTLDSIQPKITGDGQYITFSSWADAIVAGDTNGNQDIFKYKVSDATVTRVSVDTASAEATGGNSYEADVSSDGRYIVFQSDATNLVAGDGNALSDVFYRDTQLGTTVRVSVDNASTDSDGASHSPSVSDDGRYVVYHSTATDLLNGTDPTGATADIFIRDMVSNEVRIISKALAATATGGTIGAVHISNDGKSIIFSTSGSYVPGDTGNTDVYIANNPFLTELSGGADIIDGGTGNDTIWGGAGDDTLTGGTGNDIFYFRNDGGKDQITDFSSTDDQIALNGTSFGISAASFSAANFETIGVAYDGTTNTATAGKNVIVDSNGDVWVDNNGPETAAGYSVVANVSGDAVTFSDIDIVE